MLLTAVLLVVVVLLLLPQLFSQDQLLLLPAAASADLSPAMAAQLLPQLLRVARQGGGAAPAALGRQGGQC